MKTGYEAAIGLAREKLSALSPEVVSKRCGIQWDGTDYQIPWFGQMIPLSKAQPPLLILFLHYLISEGTKMPTGRLIAYRDVPDALFYDPKFTQRGTNPLVKNFGADPERLAKTAIRLGGKRTTGGDVAVTINALPNVPVTYILWRGNDEFAPTGNILFDQTAIGWLCAEDLVMLASLGTYALIGAFHKQQSHP